MWRWRHRRRGDNTTTTIDRGLQWQRWQPQQWPLRAIVFFVVIVVDNDNKGGCRQERGGGSGGKENDSRQEAREDKRWRR